MWNWRRDRQPCSRHWSRGRNWSCYRRLNVEVPVLNFLHLTVETTFLFSSDLKDRFGARQCENPSFCIWHGRSVQALIFPDARAEVKKGSRPPDNAAFSP